MYHGKFGSNFSILDLENPKRAAFFTAAIFIVTWLVLSQISGPSDAWVVPENLPHQGGYSADTPGLRAASVLENYFLGGAPFSNWFFLSIVLLAIACWRMKKETLFASLTTLIIALSVLWYTHAPTARHRCKLPASLCASNLVNIGTAMEFYKEEHDDYPQQLPALLPGHLRELPTCPISKMDYELEFLPNGYLVRCRPHPKYYAGNDCTGSGKGYLSLRDGGEVLVYSSEDGLRGLPDD